MNENQQIKRNSWEESLAKENNHEKRKKLKQQKSINLVFMPGVYTQQWDSDSHDSSISDL